MPTTHTVPKRGAPKRSNSPAAPALVGRATVKKLVAHRDEIIKAQVFRPATNAEPQPDEADPTWEGIGALTPPYDPFILHTLLENSNSLRQCIDSYVTNIDAFGHRFEPVIDLNAADADNLVRQYVIATKAKKDPTLVTIAEPEPDEIEAVKKKLGEKMAAEAVFLQHFFENASLDYSFVTLRRRMRQDLETQGNAYWECLRQGDGKLAGFEYIQAFTMRHFAADRHHTKVTVKVKENQFDYGEVETEKRFRRYVQVFESRTTWFKELGDPRVISKRTGAIYPSLEVMKQEEKHEDLASEILHFRVHSPKSSYGIPRWVGTLLSVLGSRQAEEVNLDYFESKSVPPLAILVTGGRMTKKTVDRVQDFIENEVKGKRNYHKILLLEAENSGPSAGFGDNGKMKIDLKPLTAAQHNDALFQNYDQNNIDKVGMSFRLPRMLRGDIRDFNRATGEAALDFAESQVFKPERDEFDFTMNRKVLSMLGIRFWRFTSNASTTQNIKDLSDIILAALEGGGIVPAEARDLLEKVFNRPLRKIDAPWTRQPFPLTIKGIVPPDELMAPGMVSPQVAASGATVGAPGMGTGAPTQATDSGTGVGAPPPQNDHAATGSLKLTGTDAASVVTVNEARADAGKGPLQLPPAKGGGEDPDGYLTVAEFQAKRKAFGQTQGQDQAQAASGAPVPGANPNAASHKAFGDMVSNLLMLRKAMEVIDRQEFAKAHTQGAQLGPHGEE